MGRFIAVRLVQTVVVLFLLLGLVVVLARVSGSPALSLLQDTRLATEEHIKAFEAEYGLDKPIYEQYFVYLGQVLRGNLGRSLPAGTPVLDIFMDHLPATLKLAAVAIPIAVFGGIATGTVAALTRGGAVDTALRLVLAVGQAAPAFWFAIILILVFGVSLGWAPFGGDRGWDYVFLPAVAVSIHALSGVARVTRTALLNVLRAEYVTVARAKGLSERVVIMRHALRNALLPIVTYTGMIAVSQVLLGGLSVEVVFAWPGIGNRAFQALEELDYGVIQGFVLLFGAIYVLGNLIVDISYGYLDPRISRGEMS